MQLGDTPLVHRHDLALAIRGRPNYWRDVPSRKQNSEVGGAVTSDNGVITDPIKRCVRLHETETGLSSLELGEFA